jgi:hypothetical protein
VSAAKSVLRIRIVPTFQNSMFYIGAGYNISRVVTWVSYTVGCNNLVSSEATVNGFLQAYKPKVPIKARCNQRIQIQKRSHGARGVNMAMSPPSETLRLLGVYRETNDQTIRATLVSNYEPLVRSLCRKFSSSREPQEDLF